MKKLISVVALSALMLSGCSARIADMTVGSTKNLDINSAEFVKGERVIGEDIYPVVLFPFGIPNLETAMDNAIESDRCAVGLTDVVVTQLNESFIVGRFGYRVEGDLVIDRGQPGCEKVN